MAWVIRNAPEVIGIRTDSEGNERKVWKPGSAASADKPLYLMVAGDPCRYSSGLVWVYKKSATRFGTKEEAEAVAGKRLTKALQSPAWEAVEE